MTVFSLALVACLTVWLAPMAAAHTTIPSNGPNQAGYQFLEHVVSTGDEYDDQDSITIAPGTGANETKSWSVSNTYGGSVTLTVKVVQAQFNYNFTSSTDVSQSCNADVNTTNFDEMLEWQSVFVNYSYDVYWHNNLTNQDTPEGTGWAKVFSQPRCAIFNLNTVE